MIALQDKSRCTGCTACMAACPLNCIEMIADKDGFQYPEINQSQCVSCGKCEKACPVSQAGQAAERTAPVAYGVRANDLELRLSSSSGGVFSLLAEEVLSRGGVVFGAVMAADCKSVFHVMAETLTQLEAMRGSKYLQSGLGDAFRNVKDLLAHRPVMFTGTPCQIDGLKAYLGQEEYGLLCVEVICHGVPTPKLWKEYVEYRACQSGGKIVKAEMRHKKCGWHMCGSRLENSKRRVLYSTLQKDPYIRMFLRNLCLRPSCYQCVSKGLSRKADLTAGDFWGVERVAPELDDNRGTSLVLVHTEKGKQALEQILPACDWRRVDCDAALSGNPAMLQSVPMPGNREKFMEDMDKMSFPELERKYVPVTPREWTAAQLERMGLLPLASRMRRALRRK